MKSCCVIQLCSKASSLMDISTLFNWNTFYTLVIKTENYIYGLHSWDTLPLRAFLTSKGENTVFPFSTPSRQCCAAGCFELSVRNNKHPNSDWRGVQIVLSSLLHVLHLHGEAPPQGPIPHLYISIFSEQVPLSYTF